MMEKIIITIAAVILAMGGMAGSAVDSNSIVEDGIEYSIQTDKAVYSLGENVQMLYRVTNLSEDEVEFIFTYGGLDNTCDWMVDKDELRIWDNLGRPGTAVMTSFNLSPSTSYEYTHTWNMTYKNGDDILPGNYNVTGVLGYHPDHERYVPVSVQIEIIPEPAMIYYVDADAPGPVHDGSSWATAYKYLQDALTDANSIGEPVEIRVADGIYTPDSNSAVPDGTGDRTATFELINGVTIKGRYVGFGEPADPNIRDIRDHETILSGDLYGNDMDVNDPADLWREPSRTDNSYHVVTGSWTDPNAVLDGFTITGGNANSSYWGYGSGGGMLNVPGSPRVSNCKFTGNSADDGGGMYNDGYEGECNPILINCVFSGNYAGDEDGGGMYNFKSSPRLANCTFSGNSTDDDGGAIYSAHSSPMLTNCTFIGNSCSGSGGAISCRSESSPILTNCTFTANTAYAGGGMHNIEATAALTNCIFTSNSAEWYGGGMYNDNSRPMLTNCTFSGNSANSSGGGMYNCESSPTLTNCTFGGNSAEDNGGAMYNKLNNLVLTNCLFNGNLANSGGGMYNWDSSPTLTNCTFSSNSAGQHGGGIYYQYVGGGPPPESGSLPGHGLIISNSILWSNTPEEIYVHGLQPMITYSDVQGGWAGEGNIDIDPSFVAPGSWDANGAWIDGDYHLLPTSRCIDAGDNAAVNLTIDLDGNPRIVNGIVDMGAYEHPGPRQTRRFYVDDDATGANDGSSWADAYNYLQDALAVAWSGDEIRVAKGTYKPDDGAGITPGDRYATFQLINGVTIKGGCAGFGQPDPNARDIEIYETILSGDLSGNDADVNNPAQLLGEPSRVENSHHVVTGIGIDYSGILDGFTIAGGVNSGIYNDNSSPTLANCNFNGNSEGWGGGGMHNWYSNPKLTNCTFYGNMGGHGGGMYNYKSNPTLINCSFNRNYAQVSGGGMYNQIITSTLTKCSFTRNSAGEGGGMYNWDSRIELNKCVFTGNWSDEDDGGGICSQGSDISLANCTFRENSAKDSAGGMLNAGGNLICVNCAFDRNLAVSGAAMVNSHSSAILENCEFTANLAEFYGGAISHYWKNLRLKNCVFASNRAIKRGGAISIGYCNCVLTNCTFNGNSSDKGGAMCISTSHPILTNCIMWGDMSEQGNEIYLRSWDPTHFSEVTINYSDLKGGSSAVYIDSNCILNWGDSNINSDPYFGDPNSGDYHLLGDSPCIDAGDPNYVVEPNETDLDGKPRVIGGRIDMGAYEYSPPIPAEVKIVPRTINLASKGKWIICYIWLGEDYNVADINPNTVFLQREIQAQSLSLDEGQQVATAKFNRSDVQEILDVGEVELTITGRLTNGFAFEGTDVIRVIDKGRGK